MPKRAKNDPDLGDTGTVVSIRDISEFVRQLEEEDDLTASIANLSDRLPELYKIQEEIHKKKVAQNRSQRRLKDFLVRADFLHAPGWEDRLVKFVRDMHREMFPQGPGVHALIKETHRWKEAERQSDERAKEAESKLKAAEEQNAISKRLLAVPSPVRNSALFLRRKVHEGLLSYNSEIKNELDTLLNFVEALIREADKKPPL